MSNIFAEDTQIVFNKKILHEDSEHVIDNDTYTLRTVLKKEYTSPIYSYNETDRLLISKVNRFGKDFYKIVFFCDKNAWNLIEVSTYLDVRIKRLSEDMFFISGNTTQGSNNPSQISFCKIKPSTKVEEFTITFAALDKVYFFGDFLVISYYEEEKDKKLKVVAKYDITGKFIKYYINKPDDAKPYKLKINQEKVTFFA